MAPEASPHEDTVDDHMKLLKKWRAEAHKADVEHAAASLQLGTLNLLLGVPAVIFSAVVGSTVFATLTSDIGAVSTKWRVALSMISFAAAILTSLQTFLRFSETKSQHQNSWAEYHTLTRRIDDLMADITESRDGNHLDEADSLTPQLHKRIRDVEKALDRMDRAAPPLSASLLAGLSKQLRAKRHGDGDFPEITNKVTNIGQNERD